MQVNLTTTGADKTRITVALAAAADGSKLRPFVIFKGKRTDRGRILKELSKAKEKGYSDQCIYAVQDDAWMDEQEVKVWIDKVLQPKVGLLKRNHLIILDSYEGELSLLCRYHPRSHAFGLHIDSASHRKCQAQAA